MAQYVAKQKGSGCTGKDNGKINARIEEHIAENDGTITKQLGHSLAKKRHAISKSTILKSYGRSLGWTYRGSSYCQLIREANKEKHLQWAIKYHEEAVGNGFQ